MQYILTVQYNLYLLFLKVSLRVTQLSIVQVYNIKCVIYVFVECALCKLC